MSKQILTEAISSNTDLNGVASRKLAATVISTIRAEILSTGRFAFPGLGTLSLRATPKRTARNPRTGEKVAVKAGATVRFKAAAALKTDALSALKKNARKAARTAEPVASTKTPAAASVKKTAQAATAPAAMLPKARRAAAHKAA